MFMLDERMFLPMFWFGSTDIIITGLIWDLPEIIALVP